MPSRLTNLIKYFGVLKGLKTYYRLKSNNLGWFPVPHTNNIVHLRNGSCDGLAYKQVFIENQYNICLPFQPKNIIDAGANIGLAALYFAERFPQSQIIAIEPSSNNFESILKNTSSYKNISAINKGLWNKDCHLEIVDESVSENSYMVQEVEGKTDKSLEAISIETIMKAQNWEHIDILKIDIEGSEKEVFEKNYEYWLPKTKAIYIELHDNMRKGSSEAVFAAIKKYNFSTEQNHENYIFINKDLTAI